MQCNRGHAYCGDLVHPIMSSTQKLKPMYSQLYTPTHFCPWVARAGSVGFLGLGFRVQGLLELQATSLISIGGAVYPYLCCCPDLGPRITIAGKGSSLDILADIRRCHMIHCSYVLNPEQCVSLSSKPHLNTKPLKPLNFKPCV